MFVSVEAVSKRFDGLLALDQVSLEGRAGEVTAVIGPNGSGKTTLLNCLSGVIPIDSGRIVIDGTTHSGSLLPQLVEIGITRTFQNVRLFERLSVLEHVVLAARSYRRSHRGRRAGALPDPRERAQALLARVGLERKAGMRPNELSYGERRRLEIARGLAIEPHLLLLDEPAAGSTRPEQETLSGLFLEIAAQGVAVILVEHHMEMVARTSSRVYVMNFGHVMASGTIAEIRNDPQVIAAYLGANVA